MIKKEMLGDFRRDFEEAMKALESKYDLKIDVGGITYDEWNQNLSVSVKAKDYRGGEQATFNRYCNWYGFTPADYKRRFTERARTYEIVGFDTASKKYPIVVREVNTGTEKYYNLQYLKDLLGLN